MERKLTAMAMAAALGAVGAVADVTWPADFWTQVTNSMAIPAGSQIGCGSQTFEVAATRGDSIAGGTLGSAVTPFDSRWRTTRASLGSWLDSRPCGVVLTFR